LHPTLDGYATVVTDDSERQEEIALGKIRDWAAITLTIFEFMGSMIAGVILTDIIGITTPGS
jgi:hypothetical protein